MDKLRTLRTFIMVADQASFAGAARRLAISPTTVTRSIAALEESLGVQLLSRTTRSVRLTHDGAAFLERCRAALAELDTAFDAARGSSPEPRGILTVTAPVMFGKLHVLPIVVELLEKHPALEVRLLLMDRMVRLVEEGVDIAVRIADLADSALHALKIGEVQRMFAASPDYLEKRGTPASTSDLRHHELIAIEDEAGPHGEWSLATGGRSGAAPVRLIVNNVEAAISASIAGLGIVRALSYQLTDHVEAGRLKQICIDEPAPSIPVSLLFQGGRRDTPNIRAFVTAARQRLGRPSE